jgi:uncharacterized protein (DUF433 family)
VRRNRALTVTLAGPRTIPSGLRHPEPALVRCYGWGRWHRRFAAAPIGRHTYAEGRSKLTMTFTRITVQPNQMGGVPCIRGLRIPVATVVDMVADGMTIDEILAAYPDLEAADVEEALHYAAEAVRERELPIAGG